LFYFVKKIVVSDSVLGFIATMNRNCVGKFWSKYGIPSLRFSGSVLKHCIWIVLTVIKL